MKQTGHDSPRPIRSPYGVAALSVLLATLARMALNPIVGASFPFATYFLAVMFMAWYGGLGPSLFALAFGMLAASYFFLYDESSLALMSRENIAGLMLYLVVGTGLALLGEALHRAASRAQHSAAAITRGQELLSATLSSIGDAVIVTDNEGRVTFLNPVAESLTAWKQEEAFGRPLDQVFRIMNEDTRAAVESPVTKVLREGVIVGLANHTVLIARGGREIPIDDSGAPIRSADKNIAGVILVFRDVSERKRNEEALLASQERFSKAFRSSPLAMSISRFSDRRFIDINDSFLDVTGYKRDEVMDRTGTEMGIWPTEQERARVPRIEDIEGSLRNVECQLRLKSGEIHTFSLSAEVIEIGGEKCVLTVIDDITERKRAEEALRVSLKEKELLLREVHHRVKNNLQVISSLLNIQSRYIHDEQVLGMFRETQNRVKSIAFVHEQLNRSKGVEEVEIGKYIHSLADHLYYSFGVEPSDIGLSIEAENLRFDVETAIPCGLIINELVSNALKYAFPAGRKGKIRVALRSTGGRNFSLKVSDNGIGMPKDFDLNNSSSLGLRIVKSLVEQLEGKIEIGSETGTQMKINFKTMKYRGRI